MEQATDEDHPTQVLRLLNTKVLKKPYHEINFTYVGDGRNNVANALMQGRLSWNDFPLSLP